MPKPDGQSWLAVAGGRVVAMVAGDSSRSAMDAFAEWRRDLGITEIVRVSDAVARRFYGKLWPGRDAALAQLAQEAERGS